MIEFTTSFVVERTPGEVFDAINDVRGWWGEDVHGSNDKVGDEFISRVPDIHSSNLRYSRLRVSELVPNEKVVWLVLDNHEQLGTTVTFEIAGKEGRTEIRFAHRGSNSKYEYLDVYSNVWDFLMPSLMSTTPASRTTSSAQAQRQHDRLEELIERLLIDEQGLAVAAEAT